VASSTLQLFKMQQRIWQPLRRNFPFIVIKMKVNQTPKIQIEGIAVYLMLLNGHGMSLDTATITSKDWIEHASACMPTGNHRPHDSMNTHAGASNCSQGNNIGSGAISSTHDT